MLDKSEGDTPEDIAKQPEAVIPSTSIETESGYARDKVCPSCGTINTPASRYCYKCGAKLPDAAVPDKKICPGCHATNSVTSQYCYKCGLKLPEKAGTGYEYVGAYGGFWIRLLAYIIDGILLNIVNTVISVIILITVFDTTSDYSVFFGFEFLETIESTGFWLWYGITILVTYVIQIAYYTVAVGKWGRTVGKSALRLKVLKSDGSRVSYWRAFGRSWAYILNGFTLGIGFLIIAFTEKKQGLHDFICDTIVIKTD